MPKRRINKLDSLDAEELSNMLESRGWQLVQQRIELALRRSVEELQQPLEAVPTAKVRGVIEGLRLALGIPEILKKEAKGDGPDRSEA